MRSLLAVLGVLFLSACHGGAEPQDETHHVPDTAQMLDEAAVRSAMEGVWLFAERDTPFAGGSFDGIRFDASGRWQTLDVLEDGTVMPAQNAVTGSSNVTLSDTLVQTNLLLDSNGLVPLHVTVSADGQRMHWVTDTLTPEYQLERSSALVGEPIPPPLYHPASDAEALAAVQGVWLFNPDNVSVGGTQCDGIRFDTSGRFELLGVDTDGKLVPVQAARSTGQVSFSIYGSSVQVNLHFDSGGGVPAHSGWSSDREQMTWALYMGPVVTLRRTNVNVEGPIPPAPYFPTTQAEALAAVQGTWLFSQSDVMLGGTQCDGIRFDENGRFELLDVDVDGKLVPSQAAVRTGQVSFSFMTSPLQVNLQFDSGGTLFVQSGWSIDREQMTWAIYVGPVVTLRRTSATVD